MGLVGEAIVFTGVGQVALQTLTFPEPGPRDVVVRTEFSAISPGTERSILTGTRTEDANFPSIPGYQSLGVVEQVGAEVKNLEPGQRVLAGKTYAPKGVGLSWGGHTGLSVLSADEVVPVPQGAKPHEAVFAWLPAVALHGHDVVGTKAGDKIAVCGQGLIGQFVAQFARLLKAQVVASDANPFRVRLSNNYSADYCADVKQESLEKAVKRLYGEQGADLAFETTGIPELVDNTLNVLKPKGRFVWQGWYPDKVNFYFMSVHWRELVMHFPCSFGGLRNLEYVLKLLSQQKLTIEPFITHILSASDCAKGYQLVLDKEPGALGIIFDWRSIG